MPKFKLLIILLCFTCSFSWAQTDSMYQTHITQPNGLSSNYITSIYQDSRGFMWFGTRNGLCRYDGSDFVIYKYEYGDSNSVSGNYIFNIHEDKQGNLWVLTADGLNKFTWKKEKFKHYDHLYLLEDVSNNWLMTSHAGRNDKLWMATWSNELLQFDKITESYSKIILNEGLGLGTPITSIYEGENGVLWIGTFGGGVFSFDMNDNYKMLYNYHESSPNNLHLTSNVLFSLYCDKSGIIWCGTPNGLSKLIQGSERGKLSGVTRYRHQTGNSDTLNHNEVVGMADDSLGNLWIRTTNGLYVLNKETEKFKVWEHSEYAPVNLEHYLSLKSLFVDKTGFIWFSVHSTGISMFAPHDIKFQYTRAEPGNRNSLSSDSVTTVIKDPDGIMWVGTWTKGLNKYIPAKDDKSPSKWVHYSHRKGDTNSLSSDNVRTVFRDSWGTLWIGTVGGGLNKYISTGDESGRFEHFLPDADSVVIEYKNAVDLIHEDKKGNLWIGAASGLYIFDRETSIFYKYYAEPDYPDSLFFGPITALDEDSTGAIWIGTRNDGLFKIIPPFEQSGNIVTGANTLSYSQHKHLPNDMANLTIFTIHLPKVHKDNILWIGTQGGGLFGLRKNIDDKGEGSEYLVNYSVLEEFPEFVVFGIEEDKSGNLWITTNNGLVRYNPKTKVYNKYTTDDGLNRNWFHWLSHNKGRSGTLYFENKGLLSFHPDSAAGNPYIPPVYITKLSLFNIPLKVGDESPLTSTISETEEISLTHKQNYLLFEFVALNYKKTHENRYKYKLEGLDKEWIDAGTKRTAYYQGLNPGTYTFRVIASNNDDQWNLEGTSLKVIIKHPWWKTKLSLLIYLLLLGAGLYFVVNYRERRLITDKKKLEDKVAKRTEELQEVNVILEEQHEELEQQKEELQQTVSYLKETQTQLVHSEKMASIGQLTAGIAHEINNPVNYINAGIGSLKTNIQELRVILDLYRNITPENVHEKLQEIRKEEEKIDIEETRQEVRSLIKTIEKGAERTTEIVKGLRTFSRLDEDEIKAVDIHEGIDVTLLMLHNKYKHHVEIEKNYGDVPQVECYPGKLNQVFMNLLSNAIDAIAENGIVKIKTNYQQVQQQVVVSIADTGMGMDKQQLKQIFNPFFTTKEVGKGTGLGLSISHSIIEQHKGTIDVKSEVGKGTEFTVTLPVKQNA